MLKKIGIGLVVLLVVLIALVASRPDSFRIERSAQISAPPEVVFDHVNAFDKWAAWSPWDKMDPNMERTYSGPVSGVDATYAWVGNDDVGEGSMTITGSQRPERIDIKLEFLKPFEATNDTIFTFADEAGGTKITWAMEGKNNFMSKAFGLLVNMDKMVGADFDKGLASLKAISESEAQTRAAEAARIANEAAVAATYSTTLTAPTLQMP